MLAFRSFVMAMLALATFASQAQGYPARPIKLIVPYAVGQGTDIAARTIAEAWGRELKQTIYVENKPGAGGNIGTQLASMAPADGYTLVVGTNATHAANGFLYAKPGYQPEDFEPIAMIGILPLVFVADNASTVQTMADLTRAAKAKPGSLNIAVTTTTCRMSYELFKQRADAPMFPVDYKGSGEAITAVIGGQVEFMVDTIASLRAAVMNKQVRALGVTSSQSSRLLPGIKSVAEQGMPEYELVGWTVVYAPKGVPAEAAKTLAATLSKVLMQPDTQERLMSLGIDPQFKAGDELKAFGVAEKEKWGRLIKSAGLKIN